MTDRSRKWNYFLIHIREQPWGKSKEIEANNPELDWISGQRQKVTLEEEIELLDGAAAEFDQELVSKGELSPVFLRLCPD